MTQDQPSLKDLLAQEKSPEKSKTVVEANLETPPHPLVEGKTTRFRLKKIVSASDNRLLQLIYDNSDARTRQEHLGKLWFLYRIVRGNTQSACCSIINEDENLTYSREAYLNTFLPAFQRVKYALARGAELAVQSLYFPQCKHDGRDDHADLIHPNGEFEVEVKIRPATDSRSPEKLLLLSDYMKQRLCRRQPVKLAVVTYGMAECDIGIFDVVYEEA